MTPDDIAKARSVIRSVDQFTTFLSKAQGIRFLAASKDPASGWAAALDEVERLRALTTPAWGGRERIRELERALHEALNYWVADVPGDDDNRDRLRKIAEKRAVIA